ncbi:MAG TPA: hypothetical protein VKP78_00645 [bacterium]|nr:hypothetical protein [bacterium]
MIKDERSETGNRKPEAGNGKRETGRVKKRLSSRTNVRDLPE